jgi:hypothetical protein
MTALLNAALSSTIKNRVGINHQLSNSYKPTIRSAENYMQLKNIRYPFFGASLNQGRVTVSQVIP